MGYKSISAALAFIAIAFSSNAQIYLLEAGIEGGLGPASLRGNQTLAQMHSYRAGYSSGVFLQYNFFNSFLSVRTGAYYDRKGSAFELRETNFNGQVVGPVKGSEDNDYLTVPLLLRGTFGKSRLQCFVNSGPYIGILLKANEHTESTGNYPGSDAEFSSIYKKTEFGLSAGLGVSYTCGGRFRISLEARNNLGLTNTSAIPVADDGTIKSNSLNLLLGVSYKFSGVTIF